MHWIAKSFYCDFVLIKPVLKMNDSSILNGTGPEVVPTSDTGSGASPGYVLSHKERMFREILMANYQCNMTVLSQPYPADGKYWQSYIGI